MINIDEEAQKSELPYAVAENARGHLGEQFISYPND